MESEIDMWGPLEVPNVYNSETNDWSEIVTRSRTAEVHFLHSREFNLNVPCLSEKHSVIVCSGINNWSVPTYCAPTNVNAGVFGGHVVDSWSPQSKIHVGVWDQRQGNKSQVVHTRHTDLWRCLRGYIKIFLCGIPVLVVSFHDVLSKRSAIFGHDICRLCCIPLSKGMLFEEWQVCSM